MEKPAVTWEFLEATANTLAAAKFVQPPSIVLTEAPQEMRQAMMRGQVAIDPGMLPHLDLEETTAFVAFCMINTDRLTAMRMKSFSDYFSDKNPFHRHRKINWWLFVSTAVVANIIAFARGHGKPAVDPLTISMVVAVMMVVLVPTMRFTVRKVTKEMGQTLYEESVRMTGNPAAVNSALRKYLAFYLTRRGTVPLKGWRLYLFNLRLKFCLPDSDSIKFAAKTS